MVAYTVTKELYQAEIYPNHIHMFLILKISSSNSKGRDLRNETKLLLFISSGLSCSDYQLDNRYILRETTQQSDCFIQCILMIVVTLKAAAYAACRFDMPSKGNLFRIISQNTIPKL